MAHVVALVPHVGRDDPGGLLAHQAVNHWVPPWQSRDLLLQLLLLLLMLSRCHSLRTLEDGGGDVVLANEVVGRAGDLAGKGFSALVAASE